MRQKISFFSILILVHLNGLFCSTSRNSKQILGLDEGPFPLVCGQSQFRNNLRARHPWLVSIQRNGNHYCSGTVIDNFHILTASTCLHNIESENLSELRVHLGHKNSVIRKVAKTFKKRGYTDSDGKVIVGNDIAVLKLDSFVPFGAYVQPICLYNDSLGYDDGASKGIMLGFGKIDDRKQKEADDDSSEEQSDENESDENEDQSGQFEGSLEDEQFGGSLEDEQLWGGLNKPHEDSLERSYEFEREHLRFPPRNRRMSRQVKNKNKNKKPKKEEPVIKKVEPVMKDSKIQILTNSECSEKYLRFGNITAAYITQMSVCGTGVGDEICKGDIGSPLLIQSDNIYQQIGILSWTIECDYNPGVFTRVDKFISFIASKTLNTVEID